MKKSAVTLYCCAAAVAGVFAGMSVYPLLNMTRAKVYTPFYAEYTITGENLLDPGPTDKKDRVAMYIDGNMARELYKAMLVPEHSQVCSPLLAKTAGGLECSGDDKDDYVCAVAIRLDDGTTWSAFVC